MAQSIFQMTSTPENMHLQLDELALQLLMLCQNLVDTKLLLEKFTKEGYIVIASYKYFKYKVLYIIDKKKINILGLHTAKDL